MSEEEMQECMDACIRALQECPECIEPGQDIVQVCKEICEEVVSSEEL